MSDELLQQITLFPRCPFCGYPRADGMQTHSWECEFCNQIKALKTDNERLGKRLAAVEAAYAGLADKLGMGGFQR